jgi:hypothetical protein
VTTSFFDLVRSGAASLDAPGLGAEDLSQLVHAAMDLLPPTTLADLVADRPYLDHQAPSGSWADLVAGHDVDAGGHLAGPGSDGDPFDFGAGSLHRGTMFEGGAHGPGGSDGFAGHDVGGTPDDHWPHDDLFDDGHDEPGPAWDHHVDDLAHREPAHEHHGLHDSVLHEGGLHEGGLHDHHGHELHPEPNHDPADGGPHHDGGWHAE